MPFFRSLYYLYLFTGGGKTFYAGVNVQCWALEKQVLFLAALLQVVKFPQECRICFTYFH